MLSGNSSLQHLPRELLNCQNLQVVRFAACGLTEAPEWLFELPGLAWYADAGNPYNRLSDKGEGFLESISWEDLQINDKIGSSAINEVFRGKYQGQEVAIKKFGSSIGTDGLPDDELAACLRVGGKESSRVVGAFGRVIDPEDGGQVAVMPLLSSEFQAVGKPPDLRTLSRDVYPPEEATFSEAFITRSVEDVTSAMYHIHDSGVMHGDLYAHNILANGRGESYVTDFGAASIYQREQGRPNLREKVEVRALGNYIDELLKHCPEPQAIKHLEDVRDQCLDKQATNRPDFAEILNELT